VADVTKTAETPLDRTRNARDISVTERAQFRTCRRRWILETIDNWTPKAPMWALEFGTGIHAALEVFHAGHPLSDVYDALDLWHDAMDKSQQKHLGRLYSDAVKDELHDLLEMGLTMMENYATFHEDQMYNDPWEVLAIEGKDLSGNIITPKTFGKKINPPYDKDVWPFIDEGRILVPIVHPETGKALEGRPYLSGRLDLIVRRVKRHKSLWVVDHKTTASAPNDRGLDFDDQSTGYGYIMWRLTGIVPRGTVFNYLVKQIPKDPRVGVRGNLSTAKDQLCLAKDYREAMIEHGHMVKGKVQDEKYAECYASLLAKGWDPYFRRFEPRRNEHEIMSFEARLYQEYMDMVDVFENQDKAYPNLSTWWCPSCSVAPICQAMEDGSDVEGIIESRYMQAPDRKSER